MSYIMTTKGKNKNFTFIICVIIGLIGGHDFYLGNLGKGIIKMFTGNYFSIGWLIDLNKIRLGTYIDSRGIPVGSENYCTIIISEKRRLTTFILCIYLGLFGIHDMYLGKKLEGTIKLLTFNYIAIGWIIDLLKIISGIYKDSRGLQVRR